MEENIFQDALTRDTTRRNAGKRADGWERKGERVKESKREQKEKR